MRIVLLLSLFTLAKGNYRVGVGGFAASVSASSTSRNDNSVVVVPIDTNIVNSASDRTQTNHATLISSLRGGGLQH